MGNINKAVSITDYFVSLPPLRYFIIGIFLLGILFGTLINLNHYSGLDLVFKGVLDGTLLLTIPALLTSILVKVMIKKVPFKRIAATTFFGELIYAAAYAISFFLAGINPFYAQASVIIGAALVFLLWYIIARMIFILKYRSFFFAIVQLLFHLAFLISSNILYIGNEPITSVAKFYLAAFILLGSLYLFFIIINAPMKRSFGLSSTDALTYFASQWLYQKKDLEEAFETIGEKAKTIITVMGFKRKNDEVFFVIPYVHFGPFGNLGGSEFSFMIPDEIQKRYGAKSFVFHGTVTHDLNPVSTTELKSIMTAFDECLAERKYSSSTVSFKIGKYEECYADSLIFGKSAFVGLSRAPLVTEDINFGLGMSIMYASEKEFPFVAIVDRHNAETGEITSFEPTDPIGYRYMEAAKNSLTELSKGNKLNVGFSHHQVSAPFIGKAGIKVAIFSSLPEYVLILIDSNGVTPEFNERIVNEIKELGKNYNKKWEVGVYTTDTHQINMVRGVLNPLKEEQGLVEEIKTAVAEAMLDIQPAEFFSTRKWFDINVLGAKQSIEMISTVNAIFSVSKIVAPLIIIGAIIAILFVLFNLR
ncbi:MAG: DUF2070 family protein [Candidatus Micrarchaeota archaeon]|nr:DUF2070 family protein [Candidatus Micrarchaeota archaeon]